MLSLQDKSGGSAVRSPESILDRFFTGGDPFTELANIRHTMNTLFDGALHPGATAASSWGPAIDLYEQNGTFVIECALPGYKKDDINVEVVDNRLTISGSTQSRTESDKDDKRYHYRELRRGSFSRSIAFPADIDGSKVQASFDNGVLKIALPSTKPVQSTKVSIKG